MTTIIAPPPESTESKSLDQPTERQPVQPWASPPEGWSIGNLKRAVPLYLGLRAATPDAIALVEALADRIAAMDDATRRRARAAKGRDKLRCAVSAIVGGVLLAWARRPPVLVFQSMNDAAFTRKPVGRRAFRATLAAMQSLGLVEVAPGKRYVSLLADHAKDFSGVAQRLRPSEDLLRLALAHALVPETIRKAFRAEYSSIAPTIADHDLVRLEPLKHATRIDRPSEEAFEALREEVRQANRAMERHTVTGCTPPRWSRKFLGCTELFGRWTALGVGNYQVILKEDRAAVRVDGETLAEVDLRASHLTILCAALGLPAPEGDPYAVDDTAFPRDVVKAWVTTTLGKGTPVRRWPSREAEDEELATIDPGRVGAAVCRRYPFLKAPAEAANAVLGLDRLAHLGPPRKLLTHRLMGIEATILTDTLRALRGRMVALPLHDAVLVPVAHAEAAAAVLKDAFRQRLGVTPQVSVKGAA